MASWAAWDPGGGTGLGFEAGVCAEETGSLVFRLWSGGGRIPELCSGYDQAWGGSLREWVAWAMSQPLPPRD